MEGIFAGALIPQSRISKYSLGRMSNSKRSLFTEITMHNSATRLRIAKETQVNVQYSYPSTTVPAKLVVPS